MLRRYAALLAFCTLLPGLAHAQETWRYVREARLPATQDTSKVRFFLAATAADGSLYAISSRATDTLAANAIWKLAPGATTLTLVEDLSGDPSVGTVRGITTRGNDVLVSTNQKAPTQTGGIYYYPNGSVTGRIAYTTGGYGTYPYGLATTKDGYVYSAITFQTSMRVYNFSAPTSPGYGQWVVMTPSNRTEREGHDACALSQLRDIAVLPAGDYSQPSTPFYTTRNATPKSAPGTCTQYAGGVSAWTGGTQTAPGVAAGQGYVSERLADPANELALTSYVANGITADRKNRLWVAGPDSARRWVKAYDITGTFAIESTRLPSSTTNAPGERVASGAPFKAPVDVALTADDKTAYVIDRDRRSVFVFATGGVAVDAGERSEGLGLDAPFPNPVRGASTVSYRLADAGPVRLAAYDALGRQVALLFEGMAAAGTHTATLDAAPLPAGLYLLRLEGAGVQRTQAFVRLP